MTTHGQARPTWYIGFDISTSLGWHLRDPQGRSVAGGVVKLVPKVGGVHHAENCRRIRRIIRRAQELISASPLKGPFWLDPAIEGVEFTKFTKAHASYWRIRTLLEIELCSEIECPEVELVVGVTELKTHAMGGKGKGEGPRGQVTKRQMVEAARERDGLDLPPWELTPGGKPTAACKRATDLADAAHVSHWAWTTAPATAAEDQLVAIADGVPG